MIGYLLKRPIAVLTIFFCISASGIFAYLKLPVSLMPDLESPKLVVKSRYEGFGASYIEENILSTLRIQLAGLYGLEAVESISANNIGQINLRFAYGTNMKLAFIEANEKIDQSVSMLPADLTRPQVFRISDTDIPVLKLQLVSRSLSLVELTELGNYVIKRRIEGISGVASVSLGGAVEQVISIHPNHRMLFDNRISEQDIVTALQEANFSQFQLKVKEGIYEYQVRVENPLKSIEDIKKLQVPLGDGRYIPLVRIAEVLHEEQDPVGMHLYNGRQGIVIDVHRQTSANMQSLEEKLQETISQLTSEFPQIEFGITQNQISLLNMSVGQLTTSLLMGGILSFLILFGFSANYKLPLLMGVIIPITVLLTFVFFYLLGLSINIITLSGLILGVGMLIDNAIILLDNIHVYHEKGMTLFQACCKGSEEVFSALLSSTFTTLSVFLPLVFMGGIGGVFFGAQALSLGAMLLASLIVAFLLLPVLYLKMSPKSHADSSKLYDAVLKAYKRSYTTWKRIVSALLLIAGVGVVVSFYLPIANLPVFHTHTASLKLTWSDPITIDENHLRATEMVSVLDSSLEVVELDVGIQALDPSSATFINSLSGYFSFTGYDSKLANVEVLTNYIQSTYPDAVFEISRAVNPFDQLFQDEEQYLMVRFRSQGSEPLFIADFQELKEHASVQFGQGFVQQKGLFLNLKQNRLDRINVTPKSLIEQIKYYFQNQVVTEIQHVDRKETIQISNANSVRIDNIRQMVLSDDSLKNRYPVAYFFDWEEITLPQFVTADLAGTYQSIDYRDKAGEQQWIEQVKKIAMDKAITAEFSGVYFSNVENFKALIISLLLAILLLYFILSAQFESLKQPLMILLTLPVALSGSVLALFWFGYSLNLSSMIGMIVTLGIIVNDSILKIDTINRMRKEGLELNTAITEAGTLRLKPILMTSLTTILALVPLLFSSGMGADLQVPLAVTVVGGLLAGTLSSVYMIPLIYRKLH